MMDTVGSKINLSALDALRKGVKGNDIPGGSKLKCGDYCISTKYEISYAMKILKKPIQSFLIQYWTIVKSLLEHSN